VLDDIRCEVQLTFTSTTDRRLMPCFSQSSNGFHECTARNTFESQLLRVSAFTSAAS
jgi:hypothetical protein